MKRIQEEPVLFQGVVQALIAVGVSFGLDLNATQIGSILALSAAILSFWTRQQVTPVANPRTSDGTLLVPKSQAASAGNTGL